MSDKEKENNLKELLKMIGVDTSCEIVFKVAHLENPTIEIRGNQPAIMSALDTLMVECMKLIENDTKSRLDCLSNIYMNAKKEIIQIGEEDEATKKTDKCNETDIE